MESHWIPMCWKFLLLLSRVWMCGLVVDLVTHFVIEHTKKRIFFFGWAHFYRMPNDIAEVFPNAAFNDFARKKISQKYLRKPIFNKKGIIFWFIYWVFLYFFQCLYRSWNEKKRDICIFIAEHFSILQACFTFCNACLTFWVPAGISVTFVFMQAVGTSITYIGV